MRGRRSLQQGPSPPPIASIAPTEEPDRSAPAHTSVSADPRTRKDSDLSSAPTLGPPRTPTLRSFDQAYRHYLAKPYDVTQYPALLGKLDSLLALGPTDTEQRWQERWKSVFDQLGNTGSVVDRIEFSHDQIRSSPVAVQADFSIIITGNSVDLRDLQDPMGTQLRSVELHQWIVDKIGLKRSTPSGPTGLETRSGLKRPKIASEHASSRQSEAGPSTFVESRLSAEATEPGTATESAASDLLSHTTSRSSSSFRHISTSSNSEHSNSLVTVSCNQYAKLIHRDL